MRGFRYVAIGVAAALAGMIEISAYPLPYPYFFVNPLRVVDPFIPSQIKWNIGRKRNQKVEFLNAQETLSDIKFAAAKVSDKESKASMSRIAFSCVVERREIPLPCTVGSKIYFNGIRPSIDRSGTGPYVSGPYGLRIIEIERGISNILNHSSNHNVKEVLVDALSGYGVTYTSGGTWGMTKSNQDKMQHIQSKVYVANFSINISLENKNIEGANLFINLLRNGKVADVRVTIQPYNH
ncbi:hypothetical protein [Mesorhizobium sp. SP-1A]|uniref:hypothetical protein n=1 Tax=Mesorhizobium sp. SP-1A TaxID=3077840 RepID=UPI0028F718E4|nr:hypothetical protein [Mesorhizobium sp. SP-1A]